MNRKHKKRLYRIIVASALFLLSLIPLPYVNTAFVLAAYLVAGYDVIIKAAKGVASALFSSECLLMTVATFGALAIGEFSEAAFVMVFYQVGELFQSLAVANSRKSIKQLMELCPDSVTVIRDGVEQELTPDELAVGDVMIVRTGERIAADGVITDGESELDCSHMTGESLPIPASVGDSVMAGSVTLGGVLYVKATKPVSESAVSRILEMTENAAASKAKAETAVARFAKYYTPAVMAAAAVLAIVCPLILGDFWSWFYRACTLLVISCPCALVLSVPLAFFSGIGTLSKKGVLVKGGAAIESLCKVSAVMLDKTGTLTSGKLSVSDVSSDEVLELAAACEQYSDHPIARAITEFYGKKPKPVTNLHESAGYGITAVVCGHDIAVGNARLMQKVCKALPDTEGNVFVAKDGVILGSITLSDTVKDTSAGAISALKALGINDITVLSGDSEQNVSTTAKACGIESWLSELTPEQKLQRVSDKAQVLYAGDGINDAPALAAASVGVSMGALATDAATEAADVVIADGDLAKLATAITGSKAIMRKVSQNMVLVILVKAIALILGALGYAGMWAAVFADVGVCVLAVINSIRKK